MLPFKVYGINLAIRVLAEPPPGVSPLHCPQGHPMRYGSVVQTGDGFDEAARSFREMPKAGAIVAFEEGQALDLVGPHDVFAAANEALAPFRRVVRILMLLVGGATIATLVLAGNARRVFKIGA